jgi:hypothetical protein
MIFITDIRLLNFKFFMKNINPILIILFLSIPLTSKGQKDKLYPYLGISNDHEFICFYNHFKYAINANDSAYIATILNYPIKANINNKYVTIRNKEDFYIYYRQIFNKELINIINSQDINNFSGVGGEGVSIGMGAIWFNSFWSNSDDNNNKKHVKFKIIIFNSINDEMIKEKWLINHHNSAG